MKKRNFICSAAMGVAVFLSLTLSAQVKVVNQPIPLNGDFSKASGRMFRNSPLSSC